MYTFWSLSSTPDPCSRNQRQVSASLISEVSQGHTYIYSQTWQGGSTLTVQSVLSVFSLLLKSLLGGCPIEQAHRVESYKVVIFFLYPDLFHQNLAGGPECVYFCLDCSLLRPDPGITESKFLLRELLGGSIALTTRMVGVDCTLKKLYLFMHLPGWSYFPPERNLLSFPWKVLDT